MKYFYPNQRYSALTEALGVVVETLGRVNRLNSYYYGTYVEKELKQEAGSYIKDVEYGLEE